MSLTNKQCQSVARVCIALAFLDGDVDPTELAAFELVMRDFGVAKTEVSGLIDRALRDVQSHARNLDGFIADECKNVPKAQHARLFEAAAHMVLADGEMTDSECLRLASLRGFLGLSEPIALAIVASVAHHEPKLEVCVTSAAFR
jgi:uncharacterized tellurite resistance protein B-like protein